MSKGELTIMRCLLNLIFEELNGAVALKPLQLQALFCLVNHFHLKISSWMSFVDCIGEFLKFLAHGILSMENSLGD